MIEGRQKHVRIRKQTTAGMIKSRDVNNSRQRNATNVGMTTRRDISRYPRNETTAVRITATAGLTAAQETTEKSGDANNSNNAKIVGDTISKRVVNNSTGRQQQQGTSNSMCQK